MADKDFKGMIAIILQELEELSLQKKLKQEISAGQYKNEILKRIFFKQLNSIWQIQKETLLVK